MRKLLATLVLIVGLSVTAKAQTTPSVILSWSEAATATVTSFNVYRGTVSGGPYTKVGSTANGTTLTYTDTTATVGTQFFYVVTAVNGTSESAKSNEASAVILAAPPAPTGLTIVVK